MTVYTALPTDDLNLAVEVTESNDMVTINITPAIVNTGGGGGSGTVTNVATGTGLTGGPITLTGTIAIDSTVATLIGTQTLTNKTLTSPVLGGTTTSASGNIVLDPATQIVEIKGDGASEEGQLKLNCHANTHGQTIKAQPHSATITNTMLLPTGANSTLVSEVSTSTLTNKTLTDPVLEKITTGNGLLTIETDYSNPAYAPYNGSLILENYANPAANQLNIASFNTGNNHEYFRFGASGTADDGTHDANFQLRGSSNSFASMEVAGNTETSLIFNASSISFHNQYAFPTTDGTANQVLQTDGAGNLSFATVSGGGGATDLNSLTDVTITSVQNNDLLMYNSVATKWQNTNLGVSVTPTLSGAASIDAGQPYTLTISNNATYQDPAYFVEVFTGSTKVVANSAVTDNLDGTLTFTAPATGTHEIRVKCQDFGDLQSEEATLAFTSIAFGGTFRYWRVANITGATGNNIGLYNVRYFTGAGQTGTSLPSTMTSETTPTPFVVTKSYEQGGSYAAWKAYDLAIGGWWWLLSSANVSAEWNTIDLGSSQAITSMTIGPWYSQAPTSVQILASNTGAFSGEETLVTTAQFNNGAATTVINIG